MGRRSRIAIAAFYVAFGIAIPVLVIGDNREAAGGGGAGGGETAATGGGTAAGGTAQGGGATQGGAAPQGKLIFTQSCGTCHTLADAGTSGQVGPVLDQIEPDTKRVLAAIKKGGSGSGAMPANIVSGKEAQAVAEYVSSVAGK